MFRNATGRFALTSTSSFVVLGALLGVACGGSGSAIEDGASAESALATLDPAAIVGALAYGQTSPQTPYDATPRYRAYSFAGRAGDKVDAWVRSGEGDAVAYLLGPGFQTLARNDDASDVTRDAHVAKRLSVTGTHYVAFRDAELADATFQVTLNGTAVDAGTPAPPSPAAAADLPGGPAPAGSPTSLDIVRDQALDGDLVVDGPVVIHGGVRVTVGTGQLLVRARSILVEAGASITASATGATSAGAGGGGTRYYWMSCGTNASTETLIGPGGGGYGAAGEGNSRTYSYFRGVCVRGSCSCENVGQRSSSASGGQPFDLAAWPWIAAGGSGGTGTNYDMYGTNPSPAAGGKGGGSIALLATTLVDVRGTITADGANGASSPVRSSGGDYGTGSGGGAGGGILLAAESVSVTANLSCRGGAASPGATDKRGGRGGDGRIKLLSAGSPTVTGSIAGVLDRSLLPPLWITSATHADASATYQDATADFEVHWARPFPGVKGYYILANSDPNTTVSQTTGRFQNTETVTIPRASLVPNGTTYVHVASVDGAGNVSKNEARFSLRLTDAVPAITSTTHPDPSQWPDRSDVQLSWTLPLSDSAYTNVHYVVDHYGTTVPTKADATLPVSQKQLFLPNQGSGVWVLHLIAADRFGNLTSKAAHHAFNLGASPGTASILGTVTGAGGTPGSTAQLSINRGLFLLESDAGGTYNFQTLPAGTWEITASRGAAKASRTVTVTAGGWQRVDFAL